MLQRGKFLNYDVVKIITLHQLDQLSLHMPWLTNWRLSRVNKSIWHKINFSIGICSSYFAKLLKMKTSWLWKENQNLKSDLSWLNNLQDWVQTQMFPKAYSKSQWVQNPHICYQCKQRGEYSIVESPMRHLVIRERK